MVNEIKKNVVDKLVDYYRTTGCDRYGQISTISARQIAKTDEEMNVLKDIVGVALVGYRYGTYEGIFPWGNFKDKDVEAMCKQAFITNPNRNNGNNW